MIFTTVRRVARRGVVLRSLQPVSSKLCRPASAAIGVRLRSPSANNPAIRRFSTSTYVFVAKKATKTTPTKSKKTATSAAAKKKPVKKAAKTTTKKATAKKTTAASGKVAKKKATPKKKRLTPEEKEEKKLRLQERREKEKIARMNAKKREEKKQLLKIGLVREQPKNLPTSGWLVFLAEKFKADPNAKIKENVTKWATEYKEIPAADLERYKAAASQNSEKNKVIYEAWVKSHPAKAMYDANKARRRLARCFEKNVRIIHDARIPKKPAGPFMEYIKSRPQDGSGTPTESAAEGGKEWKSMTDAQKQPYVDMWLKDKERYKSEMKAIGINVDA